jgi:murein DD-endopeptidase MepM/ murein hydrolase activator NlpD
VRGWSELVLFGAVVAAAWTRTPAGALGHNALARWHGQPTVDVLARFRVSLPAHLEDALQVAFDQQPPPPPTAERTLPPGARAAVLAHLSEAALAEIDPLFAEGRSLEAALELHLIGAPLRERAIARARAAGAATPEALDQHLRYLPQQEAARLQRDVGAVTALATALSLQWPVDPTARITSPFGERIHPTLGRRKFHNGVDIGLVTGSPIHAAAAGRVVAASENDVSGLYVVLDHGGGVRTSYCHGSSHHVRAGQTVAAGELILDSGSTGRSTGPHLHFIVKISGRPIDPLPFRPEEESAALQR